MSTQTKPTKNISVSILGKEYPVGCPEGQEAQLAAAAQYLEEKTRSIRLSNRSVGFDRILLLAALNISHELLDAKSAQSRAV